MIQGRVSGRHVLVPLSLIGKNGQGEAEFFLDTGFAGFLTLPPEAIEKLGLAFVGLQPATLADGTQLILDICRVTILWHGVEREVDVLQMNGAPLLGMSLLEGCDIHIRAVENGQVTIETLSI